MFLLTGDASLTMWQSMQGIYFNKLEAQNSQIGDLYQMVYDKQWTFDKMAEICKDVTRNEDGVDTWTDQDFYGYLTAKTVQVDVYLDAFNIPVTTKSDDGLVLLLTKQKRITLSSSFMTLLMLATHLSHKDLMVLRTQEKCLLKVKDCLLPILYKPVKH